MALPPATDDAFVREVDEEVRRDQLSQLWTRYGRWTLIGVGLFLVALAGTLYWRESQSEAAGKAGESMVAALGHIDAGNPDAAKADLARLAASSNAGYAAVARLTQAAIAARNADTDGAVKLYTDVATDTGVAQPFRDLATIRKAMLQFDTVPPAQMAATLRPLAAPGSAWFGTAGELLAVAYLRDGKPALAGPLFAAIAKDDTAPPSIRARSSQMASSLGYDPLNKPAAKAAVKVTP